MFHPDRHSGKSKEEHDAAEIQVKAVNEANEILSDPDSRREYDAANNLILVMVDYQQENWNAVIAKCTEGLSNSRDNVNLLYYRCKAYIATGDHQNAYQDYLRGLSTGQRLYDFYRLDNQIRRGYEAYRYYY